MHGYSIELDNDRNDLINFENKLYKLYFGLKTFKIAGQERKQSKPLISIFIIIIKYV